jgi:hypothetical protein
MSTFPPLPDWVALEHRVAQLMTQQEAHGWCFDERAAWQLASALQKELEETKKVLRQRHPFVQGATFNPKRNNKSQGYVQGCESIRLKELLIEYITIVQLGVRHLGCLTKTPI